VSVCPSVQISCKHNSSLMDKPILIKLYTVVVYDLRMCMKEDYPDPKWEIIIRDVEYCFVI